jgi:hypothetical protein
VKWKILQVIIEVLLIIELFLTCKSISVYSFSRLIGKKM